MARVLPLCLLTIACSATDPAPDKSPGPGDCAAPVTVYFDADGDGHGDPTVALETCEPPEGYVETADDCDDVASERHPGVAEWCNGRDDDCDGTVDPPGSLGELTAYVDADGDGHGDPDAPRTVCELDSGLVTTADDCDDSEPLAAPSLDERCGDGVDNDCDGGPGPCALSPDGELILPALEGTAASEAMGRAVAVGDLDGDLQNDLIVGIPGASTGEAWLHRGPVGADGPGAGLLLPTTSQGSLLGTAMAAADLDGDGISELLVGAPGPGADPDLEPYGVVLVITDPESTAPEAVLVGAPSHLRTGQALSAGVQQSSGTSSVAVGVDQNAATGIGLVWVLDGSPSGTVPLDEEARAVLGQAAGDGVGSVVSFVGDLDGDGLDELAIGAPGSTDEQGALHLYFTPPPARSSTKDADRELLGAASSVRLGKAVTAGDLDGDGQDDLVVAENGAGGRVHVFTTLSSAPTLAEATATVTARTDGTELGDALEVVDLDGDGVLELVMSDASLGGGSGGLRRFLGGDLAGTLSADDSERAWWREGAGTVVLATGELTGAEPDELVLGLPDADTKAGAVVVLPGALGL